MLDICKCPYCGALDHGEPISQVLIDKDSYVKVMSCLKCDKEYHHIYQLVRVDTFEYEE